MGLLADHQIRALCQNTDIPMISPFVDGQVCEGVISYGLSSFGYDIRVANEFRIFSPNGYNSVVDPKNMDTRALQNFVGDVCIIPPNSFALARSLERIVVPRGITIICMGKSSYARCGIILNITPLESGWQGYITLEVSNTSSLPAKVYANEGIAQLLCLEGDEMCEVSYDQRKGGGKYMNQTGVTLAKI